jgi:hypothetical protein
MGTPVSKLWHDIASRPPFSFLFGRKTAHEPLEAPDTITLRFKECEDCSPTAEQIEARERERADRFKGDQLLPIIGIGGPGPGCG